MKWIDLKLKDYQWLHGMLSNDELTEIERKCCIVAAFEGKRPGEYDDLPVAKLMEKYNSFDMESPHPKLIYMHYKLGKKQHQIIADPPKLTTSQYLSIIKLREVEPIANVHKIIAYMTKGCPKDMEQIEQFSQAIAENLTAGEALAIMDFFTVAWMPLITSSLDYLSQQVHKQMKDLQDSPSISAGTAQ